MRFALPICVVIGLMSISHARDGAPATSPTTAPAMTLPEFDPQLPQAPDRNLVSIRCNVCHTPRYILNQPPLSKKTWTAVVTKMRTVYAGPMSDEEAAKIVDYLIAVRGEPPK
jgi:hypothetical protein